MKLELEIYGSLCSTSVFIINGIEAYEGDFGDKYDDDPDGAEDYACGNMQFYPSCPTEKILTKYKINTSEYMEIASRLEEGLSFGSCGWCV
jgi:hypothetical protein